MNAGKLTLKTEITCPFCNHVQQETMPTDYCQYYYDCPNCGKKLSPKKGDCCVYCSYATLPCPSIQKAQSSKS